jgi:hypothetical protein
MKLPNGDKIKWEGVVLLLLMILSGIFIGVGIYALAGWMLPL